MWGVVETGRIAEFEQGSAIVGVFVATGYDQSVIDWIFRAWMQFNSDFGHDWHLFIPTTIPIEGKVRNVSPKTFNSELAEEFRSIYGLDRDELPAIVFDNFNDEERQVVVSLRRREEDDLRTFFDTCRKIIASRARVERPSPYRYRSDVAGDILDQSQLNALGRLVVRLAPGVGSVVRAFT